MRLNNKYSCRLASLLLPILVLFAAGNAVAATKTNNNISVDISLPNAVEGVWYSHDIAALNNLSGGEGGAPYSFKILDGQLPPGFSLTSSGLLHGTNCVVDNGS